MNKTVVIDVEVAETTAAAAAKTFAGKRADGGTAAAHSSAMTMNV